MEFFEFFFSGANWGWRLLGLIWLIYAAGYFINNILDTYLTYRLGAKAVETGCDLDVENIDDKDKSSPATKDDVR
jgi:hypothetical protein